VFEKEVLSNCVVLSFMKHTGNIRKMRSLIDNVVEYSLPLYDVLEESELVELNPLVGQHIQISFEGEIHCVVTGKKIRKTYGDGMSYDAFMNSPQASPSIIRPELSRIHEGVALRDYDWEMAHHMQPHVAYLSLTSDVKIGVTRETQIPTRWIDQGAVQALVLAETPYRQLAGLIEVALKSHVSDKTNWRNMLKNEYPHADLYEVKEELASCLSAELQQYIAQDEELVEIEYPVLDYPDKIKSVKLDKNPIVEGKLVGIKGQYLLFAGGMVMNLRSHSGYKISLEY